jgi:hypothetical protein
VLVSDDERRVIDRLAGDPVWTEAQRLDARAMNLVTASRDEWKAKAERLERENRAQRVVIHEQARRLVMRASSPAPATPPLNSKPAAGEDVHQSMPATKEN